MDYCFNQTFKRWNSEYSIRKNCYQILHSFKKGDMNTSNPFPAIIFYVMSVWLLAMVSPAVSDEAAEAIRLHDPHIIKHEDACYIFSTGRRGHVIQTFRSQDLYNWEAVEDVFSTLPSWIKEEIPRCRSLWAPDVHFINGRYCVYYSASSFGSQRSLIGLVTNQSLDPADPNYLWIDEGKVIASRPGMAFNAIDAGLVTDQEGRVWMSLGSHWDGIKMFELDPATGKALHDPPRIISLARRETGSHAIEAPCIIYRRGFYYLFVSFDQCCRGVQSTYKIMVGRSRSVTGPYVAAEGKAMLEGGGTLVLAGNERFKGPGHNSVLLTDGQDYLVYHTYDKERRGRSVLQIRAIQWQEDGWLSVDEPLSGPVR